MRSYSELGAAAPAPHSALVEHHPDNQPLLAVYRQMEVAEGLASRVQELVGQLIGSRPQAAETLKEPISSGQLHALADRARFVAQRLGDAHDELSRLINTL